jgi:hypothetical protein
MLGIGIIGSNTSVDRAVTLGGIFAQRVIEGGGTVEDPDCLQRSLRDFLS